MARTIRPSLEFIWERGISELWGVIGTVLMAALSRHSPILLELLSFFGFARGAALR
jgi:hypothetical protein